PRPPDGPIQKHCRKSASSRSAFSKSSKKLKRPLISLRYSAASPKSGCKSSSREFRENELASRAPSCVANVVVPQPPLEPMKAKTCALPCACFAFLREQSRGIAVADGARAEGFTTSAPPPTALD